MIARPLTRILFTQPRRAAATGRRLVIEALEGRTLLTAYSAADVTELVADIASSNAAGGANTITLTAASSSPYSLTAVDNTTDGATGLPVIAAGNVLTIVGGGDAIERSTAVGTPAFRLFDVAAGATLNLQDLTLQNGLATGSGGVSNQGGAIYSVGTLSLDTVSVLNNSAPSDFSGIGLRNVPMGGGVCAFSGSVTMTNCAVAGNSVSDSAVGALGGGVFTVYATADLTNCTFTGNSSTGVGGGFGVWGAAATLTGCTFTENSSTGGGGEGGGVWVLGIATATISDCTFTANSASGIDGGGVGGGIDCGGTATLSDCVFTSNTSNAGGGLVIAGGTLTDCTFTSNSAEGGGGVFCFGDVTYTGCTFTANSATSFGGGLSVGSDLLGNVGSSTITLTACTVSTNTSGGNGGGLYIGSSCTAMLTNSTVSNNSATGTSGYYAGGGGVYVNEGSNLNPEGMLVMNGCLVSANSATEFGGGVLNMGNATLTNCTVTGDLAGRGAALFCSWDSVNSVIGGSATLTNCTVTANASDAGAIYFVATPGLTFLTLNNTIVAKQTLGVDIFSLSAPSTLTGSNNVFSDAAYTPGSIVADPLLAPLGNYGGPTETMALLPGSPAINAGATGASIPTTDQRGTARDAEPDIGAFEVSAATSFAVAGYPSSTTAGVAQAFTVTALDAYGNVAADYTGTVSFASSDGQAALPANYTFTSAIGGDIGVHTFSATLKTAGTQSITAADTVNAGVTGAQSGITVDPAAASTLTVAGFPSPTTAGVPGSFTVTAFDPYGNVATGYDGTISFSSSDPLAVLPADATLASGTGSFTATLESAGLRSITASDTVNTGINGTDSGISVQAAAAITLAVTGFPSPVIAGTPESFTVTALDPYGNVATGFSTILHFSSSDSQATLPNLTIFVGEGSYTATLETAGTQSISVAGGLLSGSESGITVSPAAASTLIVAGFPSSVTAGVAGSFTVTAFDPYGNLATNDNATVNFSSSDSQATLPAGSTLTDGAGSFTATLFTAGSQSISASDGTASGTQSGITVSPAATRQFLVTGFASPTTAGVAGSFTVTAEDPYGNPTPAYHGKVKFTSSDGQASLPGKTKLSGGTGSFTATLFTAGSQSITATDTATGTITGSQTGITISPAAATMLVFGQNPSDATAGMAISPAVTVMVEDPFSNLVTGDGSTVTLTLSAGTFEGGSTTAAASAVNGVATFGSLTIDAAGDYMLSATDGTLTGTGASNTFTISPAATSTLVVTGFPSPIMAGTSGSFTVTAEDAFGNTTPDYVGTVHFTSSDSQAALPADYTFKKGNHGARTFHAKLKTAGTQSITATDSADGSITGSQTGITVNPAAASKLIISAPPSVASGTPFSITVTAVDHYGNVAIGYLGTVTFTSSDKHAVLPGDYTFSAGDSGVHVFTATLAKSGNQTITVRDTATNSIHGAVMVTVDSALAVDQVFISDLPTSYSTRPRKPASREHSPIS